MSDVPSDLPTPAQKAAALGGFGQGLSRLTNAVAQVALDGTATLSEQAKIRWIAAFQTYYIFGENFPWWKTIEYKPILRPKDYPQLAGFREIPIRKMDNRPLALWVKEATDDTKPIYIAFHGRRGHWGDVGCDPKDAGREWEYNRSYRTGWLKAMADTGAGVIAVHMSGQGASDKYTRMPGEGVFALDIKALANYIEDNNIPPERIVLTGESLGGAVATMLAIEMTVRGYPPKGLAMINSFSSMRECVMDLFSHVSPLTVARLLKHPFETQKRLEGLDPKKTFLYLAHAPDDNIVPYKHRARLHKGPDERGVPVTIRDLIDEFLRPGMTSAHTGWDQAKVVGDIDAVYTERSQSWPVPKHQMSR